MKNKEGYNKTNNMSISKDFFFLLRTLLTKPQIST